MQDVRRSSITKRERSPDESKQELHAKHLLQASCYAYAALMRGFDSVEAYFVRASSKATPPRPGSLEVARYALRLLTISTLYACESTEACRRLEEKRASRLWWGCSSMLSSRASRVACRVSRVACRVSRVACRVSRVACRVSRVACRVSRVACRVSRVACRVSRVACRLI